eukprot:CAMPEP_0172459984 /NCGR_PEP_ID=MMETSP1065-20121228/35030_1 /TAXON_ID=265537 /ORGANISM="Amphiprora paludosa, Strain CCMP125" /LENGTH=253 /DNA_ID=CAMNT_0013214869 /DNA_START=80 /DNA_END=841 /DNA_ORIENTATION=+
MSSSKDEGVTNPEPSGEAEQASEPDTKRAKTGDELKDDPEQKVRAEKQVVRKEIRAKLKELSTEEIREESVKVWNKLMELPAYKTAKSVGLFLSMPKSEISTEAILRQCVADDKDIYVPQVGQNFENAHMELLKVVQGDGDTKKDEQLFYEAWPKNKWKIPEPPSDMPIEMAQPGQIDLLVVPGLAFDRNGNRLGQGKGYYDRFIERMSVKPIKLVAVCLSCQLLEQGRSIPVNTYDKPMETILSPEETITRS